VTGLFIRGAWDGPPFRRGPFYFRFPIEVRHTAYEWSMALADRHPYARYLSAIYGDIKTATLAGMQSRKRAIEKVSDQANAFYREIEIEVADRRLDPLRREWCSDRPQVLDFTRCVFGLDQVLAIVRRRGDEGWLIRKLLAASDRSAQADPEPAGTESNADRELAPGSNRGQGRKPQPRNTVIATLLPGDAAAAANDTPPSQDAPNHPNAPPPDRPTPQQLDDHFKSTFKKNDKREPAIKACCEKTGATWRQALEAYYRIPDELRRKRGRQRRSS